MADALDHCDGERFWPAHPRDDNLTDGHSSVYVGAAAVIWALEHLRRLGATTADLDFRPCLPRLLEKTQAELHRRTTDASARGRSR